jgi:hypothetical protein
MSVWESRALGRIFAANVREVWEELQDGHSLSLSELSYLGGNLGGRDGMGMRKMQNFDGET